MNSGTIGINKSLPVESKSKWLLEKGSDGLLILENREFDITLTGITPAITFCGKHTPLTAWKNIIPNGDSVLYELPGEVSIKLTLRHKEQWTGVLCEIENLSDKNVSVDKVRVFDNCTIKSGTAFNRFLINGYAMCDFSNLSSEFGRHTSNSVAAFTDAGGSCALVLGFASLDDAFYNIEFKSDKQQIGHVSALCDREGIVLAAGERLVLPEFLIGAGQSMSALMSTYADVIVKNMGCRKAASPTGWCSWYYYYDTVTEDDIWTNIDYINKSPYKDQLKVIQIDDGWNLPYRDHKRVWGDWLPGGLFPKGMKHLADGIKKQGFIPGLWVAPFSVDSSSQLFKKHPDWLVQCDSGPVMQERVYALDLTRPWSLDFIRDTFTRIFDQWGFEYVKIDFLYHATFQGKRFDPSQTTAAALRNGLKVIRSVAKDRFVLGCGSPLSPAVGLCDGMRIGYDVSSHWEFPVNTSIWPAGNFNIRAAAINAIWRQWMHAHWWQNDPDCLVVRDFGSEIERQIFQKHFKEIADVTSYGLSDDEAKCWAQLVWFLGGAVIVSENIEMLTKTRFDLLNSSCQPNLFPARWVDWYDDPDVAVLISRGTQTMIGLFNLGDEPTKMRIPKGKFGLGHTWTFRERISGEEFSGSGEIVNFPAMGPHCGKIWILA